MALAVSADVGDPSWIADLTDRQVEEKAYCYTDIYLGTVWYDARDANRAICVPGHHGVVGHLATIARLLASGEDGEVWTYVNGWVLRVTHHDGFVRLDPDDEPPLDIATPVMRQAVADAAQTTSRFIRACAHGRVALWVDHLDDLARQLQPAPGDR